MNLVALPTPSPSYGVMETIGGNDRSGTTPLRAARPFTLSIYIPPITAEVRNAHWFAVGLQSFRNQLP